MHCDRATSFWSRTTSAGNQMLWSKIAISMPPIKVACKETSIAGATVKKREVANILDAYRDPRFDPAWDRKSGYRTRSILCVPVVDELRDRCLGCLQLLNKFDRNGRAEGASFGHKDEERATNLCSVVSIAIKSATSEASMAPTAPSSSRRRPRTPATIRDTPPRTDDTLRSVSYSEIL